MSSLWFPVPEDDVVDDLGSADGVEQRGNSG